MYRPGEANSALWDYLDNLALGCGSPTGTPDPNDEDQMAEWERLGEEVHGDDWPDQQDEDDDE